MYVKGSHVLSLLGEESRATLGKAIGAEGVHICERVRMSVWVHMGTWEVILKDYSAFPCYSDICFTWPLLYITQLICGVCHWWKRVQSVFNPVLNNSSTVAGIYLTLALFSSNVNLADGWAQISVKIHVYMEVFKSNLSTNLRIKTDTSDLLHQPAHSPSVKG